MGGVPQTLHPIPTLARCTILGPKHIQHHQATASAKQGPRSSENEGWLHEVMQRQPENHRIEAARNKGEVFGKCAHEGYRAVGLDLARERQGLAGEIYPDHGLGVLG